MTSYWARSKNGGVEMTELENKAREYSIVYDTKYAEDEVNSLTLNELR